MSSPLTFDQAVAAVERFAGRRVRVLLGARSERPLQIATLAGVIRYGDITSDDDSQISFAIGPDGCGRDGLLVLERGEFRHAQQDADGTVTIDVGPLRAVVTRG